MKLFFKRIFFLPALLFLSCNTVTQLRLQSNANANVPGTIVFPFDYTKKLIVVKASINNSAPNHRFIFDTGAFNSKVAYTLANDLKLPTKGNFDNGTAQGVKRVVAMTVLDSIRFKNASFYKVAAGKLKYDAASFSPCVASGGIIGSNIIKMASWKIDYQKRQLSVSEEPLMPDENSVSYRVPFDNSFLSGVPEISVEINGQLIEDVVFDLGYNGGLVVPFKYAERFKEVTSQKLIDQSTAGIFGSNRDTLLVKNLEVKLGNLKTWIPVEFSSLNKALLGNDYLEHFTVFINYEAETIHLVAKENVIVDEPVIFIPGVLNDSTWVVKRTHPDIDLDIGDTLRTINGYLPKDLFKNHCDYFLNSDVLLAKKVLVAEKPNGTKISIATHSN